MKRISKQAVMPAPSRQDGEGQARSQADPFKAAVDFFRLDARQRPRPSTQAGAAPPDTLSKNSNE